MSGQELAEKWRGALPSARRRFKENVTGEETMTEERPAYVAGVTVGEMLDLAAAERDRLRQARNDASLQRGHLEERREELLTLYGTYTLRQELRAVAEQLAQARYAVLDAQQAYKRAQADYAEAELGYKIEWRAGPGAQQPDPTTGKINQTWVGLREEEAVLRAAHLGALRAAVADLEGSWRACQVVVEGYADRFTALCHVARLTSAELVYLGEGG